VNPARARSGLLRRALRRLTASVRARSTIAATLAVLLGSVAGSLLLLFLLQRALISSVETSTDARAGEVARLVRASSLADVRQNLVRNTPENQLVQVVGPSGQVVASSSARATDRALSSLRPPPGGVRREQRPALELLRTKDPYLVTAEGVSVQRRTLTVVVAESIAPQSEAVEQLLTYLLVFVPVATLLVGLGTWFLVGRALGPVESIRARVAAIRAGPLADRVPVPPSQDEVARLATTMNEMLERLETGQRNQRAFVSDASHELRSPIATLSAALGVADDDPAPDSWPQLSSTMAAEVGRMSKLVDDLLLLARADDQGLPLAREDVDVDDLVDQEVRRLRARGVDVSATIGPARMVGDPGRLAQVVRNLADNAAVAARSRLRMAVGVGDGDVMLTVEDDGDGIPEHDRDRVFERFVRLDDSRSRGSGGSGLGLAIVREIVARHGGTVRIDESALGGARFVVRLPAPAAG
jgi:signal transduction histidine kinase